MPLDRLDQADRASSRLLWGQQLKEQAQLDGWLRDGAATYVESLCNGPGGQAGWVRMPRSVIPRR